MSKYRKQHQLFIAETPKVVSQLMEFNIVCNDIFATTKWSKEKGLNPNVELHEVSEQELRAISNLNQPNQVLGIFHIPEHRSEQIKFANTFSLVLDEIQDPGNLGTIIRTANWFGIENIICSPNSVDCFNLKVVQASMGAIGGVNIHYRDLPEFLKETNNEIPVYGALMKGKDIYSEQFSKEGLVVIGNEAHGISDDVLKYVQSPVTISSASGIRVESLNAAVATAIFCSELFRSSR